MTLTRTIGAVVVAGLLAGCSQSMAGSPMGQSGKGTAMTAPMANGKAAGLRAALNTLFQEHVYRAAAATGAALDGREAENKSLSVSLRGIKINLTKVNSTYVNTIAEQAFLP